MDTKTFFTSDWHLGEKKAPNTWAYHRDFDSPEDMNHTIIQKVNRYVGEKDTLYVLGDVAVNLEAEKWLSQINCKNLILIQGEKDQSAEMHGMLSQYFSAIYEAPTLVHNLNDLTFVVGHKPSDVKKLMEQQIFDLRFVKKSEDFFGLHGHIHRAKACGASRNALNVSCDLWDYVPLSLERIMHLHGAVTKYWDGEVFDS